MDAKLTSDIIIIVVHFLLLVALAVYRITKAQRLAKAALAAQFAERSRRTAALAALRDAAAAAGPGSAARENYEDFCAAAAQVESMRATLRSMPQLDGETQSWRDGWSGTPEAWGRSEEIVWRDIGDFSPLSSVVMDGFALAGERMLIGTAHTR